jgi:hypothetical protein
MRGLTTSFVHTPMGRGWEDEAIGCPEVTETPAPLVGWGNAVPQLPTGMFTAVA